MSLTDVSNKRNTFMQRVQDYKDALVSGDQTDIDNALQAANVAGRDYAFEVGVTSNKTDITINDLFTRSDLYDSSRRKMIDRAWGLLQLWSSLSIAGDFPSGPNSTMTVLNDADRIYFNVKDTDLLVAINKSDWSIVSGTPTLSGGAGYGMAQDNDYLYVGYRASSDVMSSGGGIQVVDKSTLSVVKDISGLYDRAYDIQVDDQYIYRIGRAGSGEYFNVIRKSDWSIKSGTPDVTDWGFGVTFDANYVYISYDANPNLMVVDKSDWSVVSGTPTLNPDPRDIEVDENYLYVVSRTSPYLFVYNKSDWSIVSGTPSLPARGDHITVDANRVYVGHDGSPYLTVINKEDWSTVSLGVSLNDMIRSVSIDDDYIYLACNAAPYFYALQKHF